MEDTVVFETRKVLYSDNFSIALCKQEMRKSVFQRTRNETKHFKHGYIIHAYSDKAFKFGLVVNQALPSLIA